jgi:uncharacterized protein YhaN
MADTPSKTPAEELQELQADLQNAQTQNATLAKEIESLKAKITDLGKLVAEIDGKRDAWEAARKTIVEKHDKEKGFFTDKQAALELHVTPEQGDDNKKKREDAGKEIDALADYIHTLQTTTLPDLQAAYDEAKAETAAKKNDYDGTLKLAQADNDVLKDLAALHTQADSEYGKGNYLRTYFLLLEMSDGLTTLEQNTPTPDAYAQQLNDAAMALSDATDAEVKAKAELGAGTAELQSRQKELKDKSDNRRKNILAAIGEGAGAPA